MWRRQYEVPTTSSRPARFFTFLNLSKPQLHITIDNKKYEKYENRKYETNSRKLKVVSPLTDGYKKLHTKKFGVTKYINCSIRFRGGLVS